MENMKTTAQQGDVLLRRITKLPSGEKKVLGHKKLVLAEGEVTGHYHGIEQAESYLYDIGGTMVLDLKESATLTHQEHKHITLEAGLWEVGKVQEYDYFAKMVRPVMD
jgi:hypothetical protein